MRNTSWRARVEKIYRCTLFITQKTCSQRTPAMHFTFSSIFVAITRWHGYFRTAVATAKLVESHFPKPSSPLPSVEQFHVFLAYRCLQYVTTRLCRREHFQTLAVRQFVVNMSPKLEKLYSFVFFHDCIHFVEHEKYITRLCNCTPLSVQNKEKVVSPWPCVKTNAKRETANAFCF